MKGWRRNIRWLYPGMAVKRYAVLAVLGFLAALVGIAVLDQTHVGAEPPLLARLGYSVAARIARTIRPGTFGAALLVTGVIVVVFAVYRLIVSLTAVIDPDLRPAEMVDLVYNRRRLSLGRKIVVIGGGTGLSNMVRGLKRYTSNITAIVTVADDGGSSGKIRRQLNILPPGDVRNCIVALADSESEMMELLQYRFARFPRNGHGSDAELSAADAAAESYGEGIRDHAFGNLLIAAMCAINGGNFERGVRETSRVLNIRGRVLPSTNENVRLRATMSDGAVVEGESSISQAGAKIQKVELDPPCVAPLQDVVEAISDADVIVLGPGSVYTSIIPNLLLKGLPEAIRQSPAKCVYVCNVMTQPGETDGFTAFDHVRAIEEHAGQRLFQYVLVNNGRPGGDLLAKYQRVRAVFVEPDVDRIRRAGYRTIVGNFINEGDVVRHDAARLAQEIVRLAG